MHRSGRHLCRCVMVIVTKIGSQMLRLHLVMGNLLELFYFCFILELEEDRRDYQILLTIPLNVLEFHFLKI